MASFVYNTGADGLTDGSIDWASDTIKVRLVASSATPAKTDTSLAAGYVAIGTDQTLASKTRTKDDTNNRILYGAANITYTAIASGSTYGWAIVYKDDGGNGIPIAALDIPNTATNNGDVNLNFPSTVVFYLQQ